jgi:hypothetical protein
MFEKVFQTLSEHIDLSVDHILFKILFVFIVAVAKCFYKNLSI